MRKMMPILFGAGAGIALVSALNRRRKQIKTREWMQHLPGVAIVTGASAGIGAAFARALACQGYDLILVARREDKLRALAEEIRTSAPVQVQILVADLSNPTDVEQVAARISETPNLSLLVNNAGFGTGGRFVESEIEPEMKMIRVHVEASQRLMHAALRVMVPRGAGGIINVASMAGFTPMPFNATYGATKTYLMSFTESVDMELQGTGVRVQTLCPGFTYSEFHDVAKVDRKTIPDFLWMQADDVVAESLKGLREGQKLIIPGRMYQLFAAVTSMPFVRPLISLSQSLPVFRHWR